jgi:hypothetical protein
VADRPRPHHGGLFAIAQVSHRSQYRWLDLLDFRSNRSYPIRPDDAGGALDMFADPG